MAEVRGLFFSPILIAVHSLFGTIPLLQGWLLDGMSIGSVAAFMLTGPATKITNLGALKIVMGIRNFLFYLGFVILFAFLTGLVVNVIL